MHDPLAPVAHALAYDASLLVVSGAGLSVASGLPTYRGVGGLYAHHDTDEGLTIEEALSARTFRRRPDLTWRHLHQIETACRGAEPNDGHRAIARICRRLSRAVVLTQNVDGLLEAAGVPDVLAIHGRLHDLACTACTFTDTVTDFAHLDPLPACPACGFLVRPRVVLFDELLPLPVVRRYDEELEQGFDVVLSVGTSSLFPYIAAPVFQTAASGGLAVEINPEPTVVSHAATQVVREPCEVALARLDALIGGIAGEATHR